MLEGSGEIDTIADPLVWDQYIKKGSDFMSEFMNVTLHQDYRYDSPRWIQFYSQNESEDLILRGDPCKLNS